MKLENSFMHRQLWEKVYDVMELTGYNIKTNIKKKKFRTKHYYNDRK